MGDISRYRNDTYPIYATIRREDGTVMPIDGCSFTLTVNERANPSDSDDEVFQSDGVIVGDPAAGRVQFPVPGTADPGRYFFDIQMIDSQGYRRTIEKGGYRLFQDITKSRRLEGSILAASILAADLTVV